MTTQFGTPDCAEIDLEKFTKPRTSDMFTKLDTSHKVMSTMGSDIQMAKLRFSKHS